MYDPEALRLFAAIVRHGGLSASARELGLPKSTVSRRLQRLEAQAGQPLLHRQGNRMVPTEAGLVFERYGRRMLELIEQSRMSLEELREEVCGTLVLHVHEAFVRGWFAGQVECFLAAHPGVRVDLRTPSQAPDASAHDLTGLWLGPVPQDVGLRQERLGRLTRGLHAHPDYLRQHGTPSHPNELAHHSWVDLLGEAEQGLALHHSDEGHFTLAPFHSRMQANQLVLHGDAIARGQGLGVLPHWIAELRVRHRPGTLVPCLTEWRAPALPVTLLYPHGHLPRRTRAFIEHLRAAVPDAWREDAGPDQAEAAAGNRRGK